MLQYLQPVLNYCPRYAGTPQPVSFFSIKQHHMHLTLHLTRTSHMNTSHNHNHKKKSYEYISIAQSCGLTITRKYHNHTKKHLLTIKKIFKQNSSQSCRTRDGGQPHLLAGAAASRHASRPPGRGCAARPGLQARAASASRPGLPRRASRPGPRAPPGRGCRTAPCL